MPSPSCAGGACWVALLLHGLEVFDEDKEIAADHLLTDRATPGYLPKALAPDRHLPTAMGRDDGPPVNKGRNLGNGKVPCTPLGNTREIGRWRAEGWGRRAIAVTCHAMAGATIAAPSAVPTSVHPKTTTPRLHRCMRFLQSPW